jgi:hypothetical protein
MFQSTMFTQQTMSFRQAMAMFMDPSLVPVRFFGTTYLFSLDYFPPKMLLSSSSNGIYICSDILLWILITLVSIIVAVEVLRIASWIVCRVFRHVLRRLFTLRGLIAVGLLGLLFLLGCVAIDAHEKELSAHQRRLWENKYGYRW